MSNYQAIPTLGYRDADAAVEFLSEAFGFKIKTIFRDDTGKILHAELSMGKAYIMLGTAENRSDLGRFTRTPNEIQGINTQTPYIIPEDIDDHYKKAQAYGAEMVIALREEEYGNRRYTCRDTEGHIWNFGTYSPFS
ncbi:MAG: VOC family protein [Bacteroidota bacterium]